MGLFKEIMSQKAGALGVIILAVLIALAIWAPIQYGKYYAYWRNTSYWSLYPKAVPPDWVSLFSSKKLPPTIFLKPSNVTQKSLYHGLAKEITYKFEVNFNYDEPPNDVIFVLNVKYQKPPAIMIYVTRPDGETVKILQGSASSLNNVIQINNDQSVKDNIYSWLLSKGLNVSSPSAIVPTDAIFCKLSNGCWNNPQVLKGKYVFTIKMIGLGNFTAKPLVDLTGKTYGLMGTDVFGRDIFIYVMLGLPYGLAVGILASVIAAFFGTIYGLVSGYFGGIVDKIMQRILEIWYSIPALPLLILAAIVFRPSIWLITVFIAIFAWMGVGKVVRSMALQLRNEGYVVAAKAAGASDRWIMLKHVLPQLLPYTMAQVALGVPGAILTEVGLDFLGLGDPNVPTWGWLLHDANVYGATVNGYWWWVIPPGLMAALVGLAFALIGYAMDVILNPRLRER
ncbi:peptide transporter [Ignicoccus pacificus DSM 13166]|uniref:Peptide transporter n=1 Tax=Ignicoccus pacificus DSM 13166 TaxID=940294 RepID=A0A977PJ71_9CREN|nr:peptide transporter [Ignicoccus pacificus DSM 13166]